MKKTYPGVLIIAIIGCIFVSACEDEITIYEEPPSKLIGEWKLYTVNYWNLDDTLRGTLQVEGDDDDYTGIVDLVGDTLRVKLPISYLISSNQGETFQMLTGDRKLFRGEWWYSCGAVYNTKPDSIYAEAGHYNPRTGIETWRRVYGRRMRR